MNWQQTCAYINTLCLTAVCLVACLVCRWRGVGGGSSRCSVGHSCSGPGGGVAAAAAGPRPLQVLQQARQKVSQRPRAATVGVTSCHVNECL